MNKPDINITILVCTIPFAMLLLWSSKILTKESVNPEAMKIIGDLLKYITGGVVTAIGMTLKKI